jgi:NAD(P)-dependent dehydrogenase (short-subunit alcohol dehydrogenase family)
MIKPIESMTDAFCIKGLNVIVTGGNRGIGLGISLAFAQSGANVAVLCRSKESGDKAADEMRRYGVQSFCVKCDTSDMESVKQAVDEVLKVFDRVDVLVNNAGVSTVTEFLKDKDLLEWQRVIDTNLHGVANMIHMVAPHMIRSGRGGSIINISSIGEARASAARETIRRRLTIPQRPRWICSQRIWQSS